MSAEFQDRTVLVIDDTPGNLAVVLDQLSERGYRVLSARDGEEGIRRARLTHPDLILLDIMMPGIDGLETCRQLKSSGDTDDIPVIFMSALADSSDKVAGFAAGAVDYITKPLQVDEVLARVETHLALRNAQRQLAEQNLELQAKAAFLREQSRILEMISTNAPLTGTLTSLLSLIEAQAPGMLASILLLGEDGRHVRDCVAPSMPEAFCQTVLGLEIGPHAGSCGTAMFRREQVIVRDILEDDLWDDHRAALAPHGLRACWSTPILAADGSVLGSFAMYYRETRSPSESEQQLIATATHLAQIAIERYQAHQRMEHMAGHDALTGLPNRMLLEDRLQLAIAHARRDTLALALLFLDLDHFKHVNDALGHHMGDQLLLTVADRLQSCLREGDSVARLGGDEFVVLLPELSDCRDAALVADKILHQLAAPFAIEDHQLHIGGSIGISLFPNDGGEPEALLRAADAAMYQAKESGRNQYRFYRPPLYD
jgi:diguanylate cyclase (GGDEF)-like protein